MVDLVDSGQADWQLLGSDFLEVRQLYPLDWGKELNLTRVFAGSEAGPLATLWDDRQLRLYTGGSSRPDISIWSCSGRQMGMILWEHGRVIAGGWTPDEQLVLVEADGKVRCYDVRGNPTSSPCSFGREVETEGVSSARVSGKCIAAVTQAGSLYVLPDIGADHPRVSLYWSGRMGSETPAALSPPRSFVILPPPDNHPAPLLPEVVVAIDSTLMLLDSTAVTSDAPTAGSHLIPRLALPGPVALLEPSPDGRFLAAFVETAGGTGKLVIVRTSPGLELVSSFSLDAAASESMHTFSETALPEALPETLAWMGFDALVLAWEGLPALLVVSSGLTVRPDEELNGLEQPGTVEQERAFTWWLLPPELGPRPAMIPERDSLLILGDNALILLRRVPPPLRQVLGMGSLDPGAMLFDARRLYEAASPRSTAEVLELVREGALAGAVAACLAAARTELDPGRQEALLRAACYGRAFCALPEIPPSSLGGKKRTGAGGGAVSGSIGSETKATLGSGTSSTLPDQKAAVQVARTLRALRALHDPAVGMPLTADQLEHLGWPALLRRLVSRRHYALARRLASAEGLPEVDALAAWARDKISAGGAAAVPDTDLLTALRAKLLPQHHGSGGLETSENIPWAEIALHAAAVGRPRLAASLLEAERRPERQVPLLLRLGEPATALAKAEKSADGDLMLEAALAMWSQTRREAGEAPTPQQVAAAGERFWTALAKQPRSYGVFAKYYSFADPAVSIELFEKTGQGERAGELHVAQALQLIRDGAGESLIQTELARSRDAFVGAQTKTKDTRFEAAQVTAMARLREQQLELEASSLREGFVGLSVADTIRQCYRLGLGKQAAKFAQEYSVSEKQRQVLALDALASQHDWQRLQAQVTKPDRSSIMTVEDYIRAARSHGAPDEVLRWLEARLSKEGPGTKRGNSSWNWF